MDKSYFKARSNLNNLVRPSVYVSVRDCPFGVKYMDRKYVVYKPVLPFILVERILVLGEVCLRPGQRRNVNSLNEELNIGGSVERERNGEKKRGGDGDRESE